MSMSRRPSAMARSAPHGRKAKDDDPVGEFTTLAYRYALLRPLDWGEDCDAELRRANTLWNKLVEIERSHRDQVREIAAAEVAAARAEYGAADAAFSDLCLPITPTEGIAGGDHQAR